MRLRRSRGGRHRLAVPERHGLLVRRCVIPHRCTSGERHRTPGARPISVPINVRMTADRSSTEGPDGLLTSRGRARAVRRGDRLVAVDGTRAFAGRTRGGPTRRADRAEWRAALALGRPPVSGGKDSFPFRTSGPGSRRGRTPRQSRRTRWAQLPSSRALASAPGPNGTFGSVGAVTPPVICTVTMEDDGAEAANANQDGIRGFSDGRAGRAPSGSRGIGGRRPLDRPARWPAPLPPAPPTERPGISSSRAPRATMPRSPRRPRSGSPCRSTAGARRRGGPR